MAPPGSVANSTKIEHDMAKTLYIAYRLEGQLETPGGPVGGGLIWNPPKSIVNSSKIEQDLAKTL